MTKPQFERRTFKAGPKLVMDVFSRQAGTLSKAILEGVMNGVDARANEIRITLTPEQVRIEDDGWGFKTRDEILSHFEVVGQEHDASENKIYGAFRMGRGQLFYRGVNRWRSHEFLMVTNLAEWGLDYELADNLDKQPGCTVEVTLYKPLLPSDMSECERELREMVRYVSTPVLLNGRRISTDPATETWDRETDDAYYRFSRGSTVLVYNIGVLVKGYPAYTFGTGGVVVSKPPFMVNFARNDILGECKIWRRVKDVLREVGGKVVEKNTRTDLTDAEIGFLADRVRQGIHWGEAKKMRNARMFTDVTGQKWSLAGIRRWCNQHRATCVTLAPEGDARGDRVMQARRGFVLSEDVLALFSVGSLEELLRLLDSAHLWRDLPPGADLDVAAEGLDSEAVVLPRSAWTPTEAMVIDFIAGRAHNLYRRMGGATAYGMAEDLDDLEDWDGEEITQGSDAIVAEPTGRAYHVGWRTDRRFVVGRSKSYRGWTDGSTYVALERKQLRNPGSLSFWIRMGNLVLHELCHDGPSGRAHVHSPEFYRRYHDCSDLIAAFAEECYKAFPQTVSRGEMRMGKRLAKFADTVVLAERAENRAREWEAEQEKVAEATPPERPAPRTRANARRASAKPAKRVSVATAKRPAGEGEGRSARGKRRTASPRKAPAPVAATGAPTARRSRTRGAPEPGAQYALL